LALGIDLAGINPVKSLLYTAILYGITAPILIGIIMHIGNNKKLMGKFTNRKTSNILGAATLLIMTAAAVTLVFLWIKN
jgi:Mn2+/Fe2+ NRAMP family transporter